MNLPLISITRKQALRFAGFLVLYEFLTYIANDMMMPGMLEVVHSFHAPESAVAMSITVYVLGGASLQLILGPLSDMFGRRKPMIVGCLLFLSCTLLIAFSSSIEQFLLDRFLQGMGLCFITVVGYATLQEIFEEMDAVRLTATMANIAILAPLIGPLLGAIVIYYFNWRMIFFMISIFSVVALWGIWRFMPEPVGAIKRDGQEISYVPFSFSTMLKNYKSLCCNPIFILGCFAISLAEIPCLAWIALSPIILMKEAKLTIMQYSLWQIPLFGATILGNQILHRLSHQYSLKKVAIIGSLVILFSLLLTSLLPYLCGHTFIWLIPGLIGYFLGVGIVASPFIRLSLFATPIAKGTASALLSMIIMCSQAIGIEVASFMYKSHKNILFAAYCSMIGVLFAVVAVAFFLHYTSYELKSRQKR